jgi:diguanylate cyclase (GGDEF)-like protein
VEPVEQDAILALSRTPNRRDQAQTVFGERTPFRLLAAILALGALNALVLGVLTQDDVSLRGVDLVIAGVLVAMAVALLAWGPRASTGWPLDVTLVLTYLVACFGATRVPDTLGQATVGYSLVAFGVFAGVFRPRNRLAWHLLAMLGLYALAVVVRPLLPGPLYFGFVAMFVVCLSLMVSVLAARLREMALNDSLTGVLNRRGLNVMAELVAANAARTDTPVTIALVDLDGFKKYNDTHGHVAGDARLVELARSWQDVGRSTDLVARYGGDEFVIILPGATTDQADELVERVRSAVDVPFSVGVTQWLAAEDLYAAIHRADTELLATKHHPDDH